MDQRQGAEPAARVLIADDHPPTRAWVREALEAGGFDVVADVATGRAAVERALELRPDIALLDINMPGSGTVAAERISLECEGTAVVMLTSSRDDEHLFAALRAGAVGYLLKDTDPERLPEALHGVLRGEAALPATLVTRLVDQFRRRKQRRIALPGRKAVDLSEREFEVLEGLREGLTTKQIAERLHVSPVTVRTHVSALLRKLRVPDRDSAVRLLDEG